MPHTLLLADDSVTIQRVIELTFADEDVNVVAVSDGDQAIERIEAAPPDIVLADIGMPGKNGYEVAQHIRQSPRLAHIPVVLLTGAFEPVDQARAAEAGCDGVLAKPFEPQLVIGRVKELLAKSHARGDARPPAAAPPPRTEPTKASWPPPSPEPPVAAVSAPPETGAEPIELHDYFDRLDAAFSNLTPAPPPAAAAPAPPAADLDWFSAQASSAPESEGWEFAAPPEPPPTTSASPPASSASPPPAEAFPAFEPPEAVPPAPSPEAPVPYSFAGDFPPIAPPAPLDVPPAPASFTDIPETLASTASSTADVSMGPPPHAAPAPPRLGQAASLPPLADAFAALLAAEQDEPLAANVPSWPAAPATAAAVDDALVEDITRRVLERLSDQVVRETVGEIVSRVAEQLVRQEIERIKAQLR